jgi:AcrR family transcriptional regulator
MLESFQTINKSRKDIIVEEAATLIMEKGYVATTMRDLAGRVGIEAASLYNHIKSKEQILGEICFNLANKFTTEMAIIEVSNETSIEKIKKLIKLHVNVNTESASLASVMNDEWRHLSEPELSRFLALRESYENKFLIILNEGIINNEFREMDSKITLYSMLSSIRWLQHWYTNEREMSIENIQENLIKLLLQGITI